MAPLPADVVPAEPEDNVFQNPLCKLLHVSSLPLAVFLLVLIIVFVLLVIVFLTYCIRSSLRMLTVPRKKQPAVPGIYLDDLENFSHSKLESQYGNMEYTLSYDVEKEELKIGAICANNLATRPGVEAVDPYVSVSLLREHKDYTRPFGKVQKTPVAIRSSRPTWNKHFLYDVKKAHLLSITIVFDVYDYDAAGTDVAIGRLEVPLKSLDCRDYIGHKFEANKELKVGSVWISELGEVCLGLQFRPSANVLDILILEARFLPFYYKSDRFLHFKIGVWYKSSSLGFKRSKFRKTSENPYFNERFSFPVKVEEIPHVSVVCELKRHSRIGYHHRSGKILVGAISELSTGTKHWDEMTKRAPRMVSMWHSLIK